jgi:two-component system sensor histidine kinase/response regulator
MAEQAAGKGLELVLHCGPDVPLQLIGDSLRLRQVLINLLGNAIKFTRKGSVSLRVGCPGRNDGRVVLDFRVIDTGIGIPAHRLEELFDPFTQADSSHTRRFGGTGLGLAISKHLVELMGGELGVLSEPDSGSEFRFALPFERDPAAPEVPPPALPGLAGKRVLLDDHTDMARGVIGELLQRLDLDVTALSDADEAMTAIHGTGSTPAYDLLLLDWDMPGVNGETLLRMLRFHGNCTRVPALLMVTTPQRQKLELVHERLLCALLDKPITQASLLRSLAQVFGVAAPEDDEEPRNWPPQERTLEQIAGARVLLVEDNRINQDVMREYLARCRASVTVAVNGREAVEWVRQDEFDLVLMDIQMPEMDGYQATGVIREAGFDDLPVIALTAHAMEDDKGKCLAAGMNDFLSKPVTPEQLVQMLKRWARRGGTEKAGPEASSAAPPAMEAALPAVLPGIDLESALHKMSGSEAILLELLVKYHDEYGSVADQLMHLLDEENWDQARQLVHKLKGASSVLDAKGVTRICGDLEAQLAQGQADSGLVVKFRKAVDEVMGALAQLR